MATLFKALARQPVLRGIGVPLIPFVVVEGALITLSANVSWFCLILAIAAWFIMRRMTNEDESIFHLIWLKYQTRGVFKMNRHYDATVISAAQYDAVDMSEIINSMKLNERMPLEKIIPYSSHIDTQIVKTRSTDEIATWEILGVPFECEKDDDLKIINNQLNTMLRSWEGKPVTFYTHRIREEFYEHLDSPSGNDLADEISHKYYDGIRDAKLYRNRIFYTVCYMPFTKEQKAQNAMRKPAEKKKAIEETLPEMREIISKLSASLKRFHARPLGMYEDETGVYSSQLSFYQYLLSGIWQKVRLTKTPFYEVLGGVDLFLSQDTGQVNTARSKRFFRSIEIKDFCEQTEAGLMDALLYQPVTYVLTTSFSAMGKRETITSIDDKLKHLNSAGDEAESQLVDLKVAKDLVTSGVISFGRFHYSLMIYADTMDELVRDSNAIVTVLEDLGLIVSLSMLSLGAAFLAQLPGVYHLRPRLVPVSSQNFVDIESLHNFFAGKRDGVPWGEPLVQLKTPSGGKYDLNLHNTLMGIDERGKKTLGHADILGASGSGKTVLMLFLAAMAQKWRREDLFPSNVKSKRLTTVYFDKDRAAEPGIRALGGQYFMVKSGEVSGFAPFMLEPTKRNIIFIKQLMKILCTANGNTLSERREKMLNDGINRVMKLPKELRAFGVTKLLENISEPSTAEAREDGLKIRLAKWAQGGDLAWVFDNDNDTFDLSEYDIFGIDGTEFLDNPDVCPAISFYLLYRVTSLLDGRRLIIQMDEFWQWIGNDAFADFVYNRLKTMRKLNGLMIPATQSPEEIIKSSVSGAMREQCTTHFYMANPKADYDEYVNKLKVPERYFNIIKSLDPLSRQFLIVKSPLHKGDLNDFAALVTLDLSGLGVTTKLLSADKDDLEIFDSIFKEGMKPDEWVDSYLKLVA